ncbi:Type I restriction modification system endonuclease (R) subunit, HsdR [Metamycoplasma auris 15026]|uniref:Type I restriction enzyme endonuclease subunit n=1 Tax=Metamycoplasma auris 15026 TaxID=1188233 RepID=N9TRH4_9BACT|nr:HsdR family type I site-specific deoxyribonuclease [Metamycoplasma auris]ENY68764.1 Type I restriction modification system endonuclease (R) subunit, HsdR [Metamycoplasma auris 15026]
MKEFNEKTRVQVPAMVHLLRLGYKYYGKIDKSKAYEIYDPNTNILLDVFKRQFMFLNPNFNKNDFDNLLSEITDKLRNDDLGRSFYYDCLLSSTKKLIDFDNPENNVFNFTAEFSCVNGNEEFRPDITLFINGLPLVLIEVKKPNNQNTLVEEQKRMLGRRMTNKKFRKFLNMTQLMIFSNNMEYKAEDGIRPTQGSFYSTISEKDCFFNSFNEELVNGDEFGFYKNFEYKDIDEIQEKQILKDLNCLEIKDDIEYQTNINRLTPLNRIITSLCSKQRLLDILKYGIVFLNQFREENNMPITIKQKHIIRYPQLFALFALRNKLDQGIKSGTIWHVQGSGKTALSYFITKFLTDYYSKRNIIPKFYFIVDRLDLSEQATREFEARGLKVNKINSKHEFKEHFKKQSSIENNEGKLEITVVNIQKFDLEKEDDNILKYDLNSQRIFIVDEAHRSYKPEGTFLGNLLNIDRDAIKIALTGTPLLKKDKETWKIFGEYIHTYYYDKSIEDGYTLKIFRDEIETSFKLELSKIHDNMKLKDKSVKIEHIVEHSNYVKKFVEYIINDFKKFRVNNDDETLGGMIVCKTSKQAKAIYYCFNEIQDKLNKEIDDQNMQTNYKVGLVLYDESKEDIANVINDFKYNFKIDILIVFNMLLTGFDSPRLKKLYLAREMNNQTLLQAITRVNRPYKHYQYGFIVDFADIKSNFEKTNEKYIKELNSYDINDSESLIRTNFYDDIMQKKENLVKEIKEIENIMFPYPKNNLEEFSRAITRVNNKRVLFELKNALVRLQEISNIAAFLDDPKLKELLSIFIEPKKARCMKNEVENRINFVNTQEQFKDEFANEIEINSILSDVVYSFKMVDQKILDIISENENSSINNSASLLIKKFTEYKYPDSFEFKKIWQQVIEKINALRIKPISDIKEYSEAIIFFKNKSDSLESLEYKDNLLEKKYNNDVTWVKIHKIISSNSKSNKDSNSNIIQIWPIKNENTIFECLNHIKSKLEERRKNNNTFVDNESVVIKAISNYAKDFISKNNNKRITEKEKQWIKKASNLIALEYIDAYRT